VPPVDSRTASDEATDASWSTRLALPFFLITLAVTFVGFALFGASQAGAFPVTIPYEVAWFAQFGPSGVAVYLTWRRGGGSAAKDLLGRLVQWRVAPTWYAVALFTAPVMAGLVLFGNDVLGAEVVAWAKFATLPSALGAALDGRVMARGPLQSIVDAARAGPAWVTVGTFGLFALTAGGLSEELGWRGYALSRIQTYYTTLAAGVVIALYWSVWHIAPPVWEVLFTQGLGPFLGAAGATVGQYVAFGTPLSILFVWTVNRSGGSVLMAVFFHASWNTTALTMMELFPAAYLLETSLLIWVVAIVVVAADRAHFFSRSPEE
jgi:membrane protease YdiL (CAAX protease family)